MNLMESSISSPRNGSRSRDRYGRDRRGNRTERSPREEQQPDAALQDSTPIEIVLPVAAAHLAPADDNAADDAAPRRRSYFADVRPETGTQPAPASEPAAVAVAAAVPTEANAPVAESAPASITEASPAEIAAVSEPISTEASTEEAQTAPEKEAPAVTMAAAVEAEAEAAAAAQPAPPASTYHLPIEQLSALAQAAGLQWVQSDAEKIAAVQAAIAAEPAAIRIPRERPAPVVLDDAPLILVETRKDLADLRLPFETHNTAS